MRKQLVENALQPLMAERAQIGGLRVADHLQAKRLKMIEKTGKLQTRTHHLFDHKLHTVIVLRCVTHRKVEFLHDLPQRNAV